MFLLFLLSFPDIILTLNDSKKKITVICQIAKTLSNCQNIDKLPKHWGKIKMFAFLAIVAASRPHYHHHRHHRYSHYQREEVPNVSGSTIANTALTKLGCSYVYGASGPNTFDCSGLTYWAHKQNGITIPRTAANQQKGGSAGTGAVGDVVCFGSPAYHVGICTGSGNFVHAPKTGDVVKVTAIKNMGATTTYRRFY